MKHRRLETEPDMDTNFTDTGMRVLQQAQYALKQTESHLSTVGGDADFNRACEIICRCSAHVVVIGMGKSGHVGKKVAASMASTGTPAFFVHAGEAAHGDLGMITKKCAVIVISHSGETKEILDILPALKELRVNVISICGNLKSSLAMQSTVALYAAGFSGFSAQGEGGSLAPTSSTTTSLAVGDALAVAVSTAKGFSDRDMAKYHPGGDIGTKLKHKFAR